MFFSPDFEHDSRVFNHKKNSSESLKCRNKRCKDCKDWVYHSVIQWMKRMQSQCLLAVALVFHPKLVSQRRANIRISCCSLSVLSFPFSQQFTFNYNALERVMFAKLILNILLSKSNLAMKEAWRKETKRVRDMKRTICKVD